MSKIHLEETEAKSLTNSFGQTASGYSLPTSSSSPSNLPTAIQFVILLNEFIAAAVAYASLIQGDEKKILDYIAGVVAADQAGGSSGGGYR